eukprot:scaffold21920_cov107-Isochrysis_galbana.AAC.1
MAVRASSSLFHASCTAVQSPSCTAAGASSDEAIQARKMRGRYRYLACAASTARKGGEGLSRQRCRGSAARSQAGRGARGCTHGVRVENERCGRRRMIPGTKCAPVGIDLGGDRIWQCHADAGKQRRRQHRPPVKADVHREGGGADVTGADAGMCCAKPQLGGEQAGGDGEEG